MPYRKPIYIWLLLCAFCVFGMVVIGGLTRLTESGLSIVEWKPISGTFPPMSAQSWQEEFTAYQQSPQYQKVNHGMSVEEFKGIFWLEYLHRLLGRLIGFVMLLPFLFFAAKNALPKWLLWQLAGIFALGGVQGGIGWYMVKSGLVNQPAVSQYRLSLHFGTALLIMACLIWTARNVAKGRQKNTAMPKSALVITSLVFIQSLLGALVAGLDAGLTYNTFPLMDGHFVPSGLYMLEPAWKNHFENIPMVQFQHRIGAYILTFAIFFFVCHIRKTSNNAGLKRLTMLLLALLATQIGLGIFTLIYVVPVPLASLHQAVATMLFALCIWITFDLYQDTSGRKAG